MVELWNASSIFTCLACNAFLRLFLCFKLDFRGDPLQALRLVVLPSIEQKAKHLPTEATRSVDFISFEFGQQPLPVRDVQILPQHISRMRCSLTPFIKVMLQHVSVKSVLFQWGSTKIKHIDTGARDVLPSTSKCLLRADWMTLSPLYTYYDGLNQKVLKGWWDFSEEAQHFWSPSTYRKCCQSFQLN